MTPNADRPELDSPARNVAARNAIACFLLWTAQNLCAFLGWVIVLVAGALFPDVMGEALVTSIAHRTAIASIVIALVVAGWTIRLLTTGRSGMRAVLIGFALQISLWLVVIVVLQARGIPFV